MVSLKIASDKVIDAGNLINALGEDELARIDHIFLTHSHLDHINDIPYLLDNTFHLRYKPLKIYGTQKTLENLHTHVFCKEIWVDYTKIPINEAGDPAVELNTLEYGIPVRFGSLSIKPVPNEHIEGSCAYVIEKDGDALLFSSDTCLAPSLTKEINANKRIRAAIFELSFPDGKEDLAKKSMHLTPSLLEKQLATLQRSDVKMYVHHLKPSFVRQIEKDLQRNPKLKSRHVRILNDGDMIRYEKGTLVVTGEKEDAEEKFLHLIHIGTMLTEQTDKQRLYDTIVKAAREFVKADAGTLYIMDEARRNLRFEVVQNETLGVDSGRSGEKKPDWPPLPLYHENGKENLNMVAAAAALQGRVINIPDIYGDNLFDFSGTKKFDEMTGYRSRSMLVIPLKDHEERVMGVLQLINRIDESGEIVPFSREDEKIGFSLASQATLLMRNQILIHDLEEMFFSFLNALANTLDNKSAFTGRHIERMVDVTMEIVRAIQNDSKGMFKNLSFSEDEIKQIYLAALVHDIGKIVTPDYLVEKSTKLETVYDRVGLIRLRVELAKAQKHLALYRELCEKNGLKHDAMDEIADCYAGELDNSMAFIERANSGSEYFDEDKIQKLHAINASGSIRIGAEERPLIEPDEMEALSVQKGTLTAKERRIIMDHVKETKRNLSQLIFPEKYRRIPEIAGAHHEKLNGKGYPDRLRAEEISLEARILAIADIFEALTASDRPYKKPNKLSEAMKILYYMAKDGELDYDIVKFFYEEGVYLKYARKHLHDEQIDEVDLTF
ncbi:HD domain-containing phosphohydrolase [Hydrogenimonas urashimensis]|uniref:HD domain-containing phosphohydrolase n=1 Tax=Hydrogenimonas urashimensis TaxID=2740515 RepID=UPI001914F737|nr:HD domain-containing phosphohydrolase [Hydrogenimonas urashimensis]